MKKVVMLVCFSFIFLTISACNQKACKRMCECADDDSKSCVDDCMDDMDKLGDDCQKATRTFAKCWEKNNCNAEDCESEAQDFMSECEVLF